MEIDFFTQNTSKKMSTKDKISVETFRLLHETKEMNLTINQICKASGITKSTFYYYYHSVDEVIDSFSDVITSQLTEAIPMIFQERTCVEQALTAIRITDECVENLGVAVASSRYIMHLRKGDYPGFQAEAGWSMVVAILKKAIDIGELPNDRPAEELASSVFFIMRGINHTWCMQGGNFNFTERVQNELRIYFNNLAGRQ